jgi:A/G-specific adenine glycosylase
MPKSAHRPEFPSGRSLSQIRVRLLRWFEEHGRPLPWRASRDAYRIWVSEVMLQQTTVTAVVPYFERFLTAFPTVEALAAADEQEVLKLWEGLGYYRRARHLHAAARIFVASHQGQLRDDPAVWADLPGVGRYILGAVLSQAFDRKLPIVEANSLRVLARLFAYHGDPREGEGKNWVWSAAEALLPLKRAGDFNQALMELGALVCIPVAPRCDQCPVAAQCQAREKNLQEKIPPPKKHPELVEVSEVGVVIRKGGRVLLCQRPPDAGRWQNMWEIPHGPRGEGEAIPAAAARVAKNLTGLSVRVGDSIYTLRHPVTRFRITMECLEASVTGGRFSSDFYTTGQWLTLEELNDYPVSSPQRKLMKALGGPGGA